MHDWSAIAAIAQLGELQTEDPKVAGSIPGLGTCLPQSFCRPFCFLIVLSVLLYVCLTVSIFLSLYLSLCVSLSLCVISVGPLRSVISLDLIFCCAPTHEHVALPGHAFVCHRTHLE